MPLPKPKKNENRDDFINRCMKDEITNRDFPKQKQRLAVCFSLWNKEHSKKVAYPMNWIELEQLKKSYGEK